MTLPALISTSLDKKLPPIITPPTLIRWTPMVCPFRLCPPSPSRPMTLFCSASAVAPVPSIRTPDPELPEITLPRVVEVPPIVLWSEPPPVIRTPACSTGWPLTVSTAVPLATAAEPAALVPIRFAVTATPEETIQIDAVSSIAGDDVARDRGPGDRDAHHVHADGLSR